MTGCELIAAERKRQIELAGAGACYAMDAIDRVDYTDPDNDETPRRWPWAEERWKPTPEDQVRKLVKAGARIAAEIDRIHNGKDETRDEA